MTTVKGQGLGQQGLNVRGIALAVEEARADAGIHRAAEDQRLEQHQQQQIQGHVVPEKSDQGVHHKLHGE
jgi:hypothetical protein